MLHRLFKRARLGAAVSLLIVAQLAQIISPLIPSAYADNTHPLPLPGTAPVDRLQICQASNSNTRPYGPATISINSADPTAGHSEHTGPVWNPTLKDQRIDWGDIVPPFYYVHAGETLYYAGMNWDKDSQLFWQYGCDIANLPIAPSTVALSQQPCTPLSGGVDVVTVHVTNTNDVFDDTIAHTVSIGGQTQTQQIADDSSYNFVFTGLLPGSYTATVTTTGDTNDQGISYTTPMSVTVGSCPVEAETTPPTPATTDPCGPGNISWNIAASGETATYTWIVNSFDQLVYTAKLGHYFLVDNQHVSMVTYSLPADSGVLCTPVAPSIEALCGLAPNDRVIIPEIGDPHNAHYHYSYDGIVANDDGTFSHIVTAVADEGYMFENESSTITWTLNESLAPCRPPAVTWKLPTCSDQTQSVTVIYDSAEYLYTISKDSNEEVELTSGTTSLATGSYTIRAYELWYIDDELGPVYWLEPSFSESRTIAAANGCGGYIPTPPTILPSPVELPHTGSTANGLLTAVVAAIATYGAVYFAQGRRQHS